MAGLTSLLKPGLEQGTFAIINLISGMTVKLPALLGTPTSTEGEVAFHVNRQVSLSCLF